MRDDHEIRACRVRGASTGTVRATVSIRRARARAVRRLRAPANMFDESPEQFIESTIDACRKRFKLQPQQSQAAKRK